LKKWSGSNIWWIILVSLAWWGIPIVFICNVIPH
jgi:hypothetical protein